MTTRAWSPAMRVILVTAALAPCLLAPMAAPAGEDGAWQMDERWEDGLAEVAVYRGSVGRGENRRDVSVEIVTRLVHLWPDTLTEVEAGSRTEGAMDVMRTTYSRYTRGPSRLLEQFVGYSKRADLTPLRTVVATVDRDNVSYARWSARTERLRFFSEAWPTGEGEHPLSSTERIVFLDQLPTRLRGLARVQEGQWELDLVESLVDPRAPAPSVGGATVTVGGDEVVEVDAGSFSARRITVGREVRKVARTDVFFFDRRPPHRLLRWERADGIVLGLVGVRRLSSEPTENEGGFVEEPTSRDESTEPEDPPARPSEPPEERDSASEDAFEDEEPAAAEDEQGHERSEDAAGDPAGDEEER